MEAFLLSLGLIFVAEMGDKTQLVALTLATRFRAGVVLLGVFVATLLVHLFSVAIGGLTSRFSRPVGSNCSPVWPLLASASGPSAVISWMRKTRHEVPGLSFSHRHRHLFPG